MSDAAIGGYVLDVAALVGACRREPYPEAVIWGTVLTHGVLIVPTAVVAETRARIPASATDILEVILALPNAIIADLDRDAADRCGALLARLPDADRDQLSAAHAALTACARGWPVATDRGPLLRSFDPDIDIDALP